MSDNKFKIKSRYSTIPDQQQAIDKLAQGILDKQKYQVLLGVTGSGKSLSHDQPVLVLRKIDKTFKPVILPIGDLIDDLFTKNKTLRINDTKVLKVNKTLPKYYVPSINPASGVQELQAITQFLRHDAPQKMYRVVTSCGREVTVTGDHNFWVLRNGSLKLVKTTEIKASDYLPVPNELNLNSDDAAGIMLHNWLKRPTYFSLSDLDSKVISFPELRSTLGYHKFYGVTHSDERIATSYLNSLSYPISSLETLHIGRKTGKKVPLHLKLNKEFLYLLGLYIAEGHAEYNYFLISAHERALSDYLKKWLVSLEIGYKERKFGPGDFQISNSIFTEIFTMWCGENSYNKKLPPWFLELSKKQLSYILSAYFSGDGNVTDNEIAAITASKTLACHLLYALLGFGIKARLRHKLKRATNSKMQKKHYFEICISGNKNLRTYAREIGFILDRKQNKLESILNKKANTNVDLIPFEGSELKDFRLKLGFSQRQLANLVNCERSYISMIEHNRRRPSRNIASKIISVFETNNKDISLVSTLEKLKALSNLYWSQIKEICTVKPVGRFVYDFSVDKNETFLAGLGGLYVHNTFTMANVIQKLQRPALVISHNKTLAAQLYQELRDFFPDNAVSYFVSYYDYYQPEAYVPSTDTYIEKDSQINDLIDKLRLAATTNLLTRPDTIIVASVSCIYNIGSPIEYGNFVFQFHPGLKITRDEIIDRLLSLQYERGDFGFHRGTFRVRGDNIDIYPAYRDDSVRIELSGDSISSLSLADPMTGENLSKDKPVKNFILYPAKHYMTDPVKNKSVFKTIEDDLTLQVEKLRLEGKELEAHRLKQRVTYDLEMIKEFGFVKGIENYSRYFDGREPGDPPYSLLEYFNEPYKKDWLVFVDESHITLPQIRGMYAGDASRKKTLVDYGFRLPSAFDNRPLRFEEFMRKIPGFIAVSATPDEYELSLAKQSGQVVEQLLRPTGIPDPQVEIRPTNTQVADVMKEIKLRALKGQRTLVTTLTKRTAEDLSEFLKEKGLKVAYLHSDVETLDRTDLLDNLRRGEYDCLVGINLLREGLDLPEVSLVAILDADKEGFLRSGVSLVQTMGRAARHIEGRVILYADKVTGSMQRALDEVGRRRDYQLEMNKKYGITPTAINKPFREKVVEREIEEENSWQPFGKESSYSSLKHVEIESLTPMDKKRLVKNLKREMRLAAEDLNFELAASIRDKVRELEG